MANQGYHGRKTHPPRVRATHKADGTMAENEFFFLYFQGADFVSPQSRDFCEPQDGTKVQRAWMPHYGIKALFAHTHTQTRIQTLKGAVWGNGACGWRQMAAIDSEFG